MQSRCALLCVSALLAGCSAGIGAEEPTTGLPIVAACFKTASGTAHVSLELAQAPRERQKGLMGRNFLAANSGMLFQYQEQQRAEHGFWMYQTLIPLDIAYLDENRLIGNIRQMEPCVSPNGARCPSYPAGIEFVSAVEMDLGFFEANGIATGDRLILGEQNCKTP